MRRFVVIPSLVVLALGSALPAGAATGTIAFTWDGCDGPIHKTAGAPGIYSAYMSVLGTDILHKGYDLRFVYGDANRSVPDAWRFDREGCQGYDLLSIQDIPPGPMAQACPAFSQDLPNPIMLKVVRFSQPFEPFVPTLMEVLVAVSYLPGVQTVNPATRYFLARFNFDHTYSVDGAGDPPTTCGGFETPMCLELSWAALLDLDGNEVDFVRSTPHPALTFNDDSGNSCVAFVVPARATTWGQLKAQYR